MTARLTDVPVLDRGRPGHRRGRREGDRRSRARRAGGSCPGSSGSSRRGRSPTTAIGGAGRPARRAGVAAAERSSPPRRGGRGERARGAPEPSLPVEAGRRAPPRRPPLPRRPAEPSVLVGLTDAGFLTLDTLDDDTTSWPTSSGPAHRVPVLDGPAKAQAQVAPVVPCWPGGHGGRAPVAGATSTPGRPDGPIAASSSPTRWTRTSRGRHGHRGRRRPAAGPGGRRARPRGVAGRRGGPLRVWVGGRRRAAAVGPRRDRGARGRLPEPRPLGGRHGRRGGGVARASAASGWS